MPLLTREQILAAQDVRYDVLAVPEWGGEVRLRSMTGADRDEYEQWLISQRGPDQKANIRNLRARLVSLSIVDEAGQRLFTDADIDALGARSAAALDRVAEAASRLNALSERDVEVLAKN